MSADEFLVVPQGQIRSSVHGMSQYTQRVSTSVSGRDIFRMDDSQMEQRYRRLFDALYFSIIEMLGVFQPQNQDTLSLSIEGQLEDGQMITIGLPRQPYANYTVDRIVDTITQKLNSAQTLQGNFDLVWIFYQTPQVQLLGKTVFRGDWSSFVASKRAFIQIHPPEDPFKNECFPQWIILGIALWTKEQGVEEYPPELNYCRFSKRTYQSLTQGKDKFTVRHNYVERLKEAFPTFSFDSIHILQQIEQLVPIRFCLYGFTVETKQLVLIYPQPNQLPYAEEKFTVYGIAQGEWSHSFTHVDFVSNADAIDLFPIHVHRTRKPSEGRVCRKCFQFYIRKQNCTHGLNETDQKHRSKKDREHEQVLSCPNCHICDGRCSNCLRTHCEIDHPVECPICKKQCHSMECLNVHFNTFCKGKWSKEMERIQKCPICTAENCEGDCYLKRQKLKKPSTLYAVYDFECCFDSSFIHIPYCVTCCFPYGHPKMDQLKKYPHEMIQDQVVFVFWGLHTEQFWDFLADPLLKGTIFFAHNARAYDSILIKSYLWTRKRWVSEDICRGRKFLQVSYPKFELTFRDSLCFIPTALRNMSLDFGITEYKKGHFPHKWMTLDRIEDCLEIGISDRPDERYFDTDFKSAKDRAEAKEWITRFVNEPSKWNFKKDAIDYCISDTILLSETLKRFREHTMQMCETIERPEDVEMESFDPFQYMTLASAMMSFYFGQCLPEQTIACIDRYSILQEAKARAWLHSIGKQDYWKKGEYAIVGEDEDHYYAFYSCEIYGCKTCFPSIQQGQWHPRLQMTYEMARRQRVEVERQLTKPIIGIWEHEEFKINDHYLGLDPRDAYKGGKTECYKLVVPQECAMVDFVSQYPTVCFGESVDPLDCTSERMLEWPLPIGQPNRMYRPQSYDWNKECLGIAKVQVLPPQNCYAPFLSYRTIGAYNEMEVCYGCCKACMDLHQTTECFHSPEERAFVGTWTISEIRYALSIGYTILDVVEVWEYPSKSHTLFRSFIVPFMYNKIVSKTGGCVDHSRTEFTEKGKQVALYLRHLLNRDVSPLEFTDSPARRTVAKLIQNAFTGKWGQRDAFSLTRSFTEEDRWGSIQILNDPNVVIQSAIVLPNQCVTLTFEKQKGAALSGIRKKNDHIVAHITAYGRIMLNRVEQALENRLVYVDTDSAYHIKAGPTVYRTGFRTGDLELECDSLFHWVGLARKSYAYETKDKQIVKQKGIAMKFSIEQSFSSESLLKLIQQTKATMDSSDHSFHTVKKFKGIQPSIVVPQVHFKTCKDEMDIRKETQESEKETRMNVFSCKRIICWNQNKQGILDTVPFGYKE